MELTEKEKIARGKVCLPLDGLENLDQVLERVEELKPVVGMFKIGKELFTRFGPDLVDILINDYGIKIFLDLKYHDIPNTVLGAAKAAAELGVFMFNVHASGGLEMMEAAKEGAKQSKVLGVTILTSVDNRIMNEELKISGGVKEQVLHLAKLSCRAGLDGIVCSASDLSFIKKELPDNFIYVTPGIKGPNTSAGKDQKRIFTPGRAVQEGSNMLVIGRAITAQPTAEKRLKAGREILKDMAKYL